MKKCKKEDSDSGENYSNPVLEHYECDGQIDIFYKKSARRPMVFRPWDEWRHELSIYILLKTLYFSKIYAMICIQENPFPSP